MHAHTHTLCLKYRAAYLRCSTSSLRWSVDDVACTFHRFATEDVPKAWKEVSAVDLIG